jgi:ABC transporter with metal-binding/Fe-S-binding domain ATP-binding protein
MKLAVLYSGGKDSNYATYLAKKEGYEISCLISIVSKNKESFMFHTPSIMKTISQADSIGLPLIIKDTLGVEEEELRDLEDAIKEAIKKYKVEGIITGAVESVYQASRIQRICNKLDIECFNPLWQKDQIELLNELVENKFEAIIIAVAAYPLDKNYLGRKIDKEFIEEMKTLKEKYKINPAGEGGEYESFVLNCPLFSKKLNVKGFEDSGGASSWRREIEVK